MRSKFTLDTARSQFGIFYSSLRLSRSERVLVSLIMRYDLTDLRLFATVVDTGSITHGTAQANRSLAAVSERLHQMENSGRVRLLERGRRGTVPTASGE